LANDDVTITHDGKLLISFNREAKTVRFWNAATEEALSHPLPQPYSGHRIITSDDRMLVIAANKQIWRWDLVTRKQIGRPIPNENIFYAGFALSPDGSSFLTYQGKPEPQMRLWSAASGEPLGEPWAVARQPSFVKFSHDGKKILISLNMTNFGKLDTQLREAVTGKILVPRFPLQRELSAGAFSPDGKTVVTGSGNQARLWDVATGAPLSEPLGAPDGEVIYEIRFSPDGHVLLLLSRASPRTETTARLWEMTTHKPLGTGVYPWGQGFTQNSSAILRPSFGPDRFLPLPRPLQGTAQHIRLWVEVNTGQELDSSGAVLDLDAKMVRSRWDRLRRLGRYSADGNCCKTRIFRASGSL
jgi:WD40 repeat protein